MAKKSLPESFSTDNLRFSPLPKLAVDLAQQRFGKWLALGYKDKSRWWCQCVCGRVVAVLSSNLRRGLSTGCKNCQNPGGLKHGFFGTATYRAWANMLNRCYNPSSASYRMYGERGIQVYGHWRESFVAFLADVGERPTSNHSLDRIDCNGNYEPTNVRWALKETQANNTRSNRFLTHEGQTLTLAQWARRIGNGLSASTIGKRLRRGFCNVCALKPGSRHGHGTSKACVHKAEASLIGSMRSGN